MGFLHKGHLSLVKRAKELTDFTVVSIFVNPTQFSPNEDLNKYPRDIDNDKRLLENENVDLVFIPEASEIYPENFQTYTEVSKITRQLEGEFRPTHFKGVTTIVNILFNIIQPDVAFFGQKDAQQSAVIKRMVTDLKLPIQIEVCPIVRESDGLAMSSRNVYLSESERLDALVLSRSLTFGTNLINSGERDSQKIIDGMTTLVNLVSTSKLEYIKIVNEKSFELAEVLIKGQSYFLLIACWIGKTRLIDNTIISVS